MLADNGGNHGEEDDHKEEEETEKCKKKMIFCKFHTPDIPLGLQDSTTQYQSRSQSSYGCSQPRGSPAERHCHDLVAGTGKCQHLYGVDAQQKCPRDSGKEKRTSQNPGDFAEEGKTQKHKKTYAEGKTMGKDQKKTHPESLEEFIQ